MTRRSPTASRPPEKLAAIAPGRSRPPLNALRAAAKGKDNLMPFLYDAVKSYATLANLRRPPRRLRTYEEVAIT